MINPFDVHRWRRLGWPRIIVYCFGFFLVIHLVRTFSSEFISIDNYRPKKEELDLPWYKQSHLRPTYPTEYTTSHLSEKERTQLTKEMVAKAKEAVKVAFPDMKNIIQGSRLSQKKSLALRERVDCWTRGKWVKAKEQLRLMPHFQDPLFGSCDRKFARTSDGQRPALTFEWQPECAMAEPMVNVEHWCEVLDGRHLLLVGDLVHYQVHELFLDSMRDGPVVCYGELNCKAKEVHLRYLRNDILSTRRSIDMKKGHPRTDVIEWPFISSNLMRGYPILILNRAPVLESDDDFINGLVETMRTIRKANPKSLILYKSTSIGHPFCDDATEPLDKPLTEAERQLLPFGWSELTRRNAMARAIVEGAGGVFIDLAALTDLRPDGHVGGQDCLRYCIPGPLDSWAQIFYNVFLGLDDRIPL
ncbi:hypothetical protein K501DRAFT_179430 [Backusella circina FSU 941]|nr:hypothetical protein K501DRAFT_179430 [Backusella circina FSU 941]